MLKMFTGRSLALAGTVAMVAASLAFVGAAPAVADTTAVLPGPAPIEQRNARGVTADPLPTAQIDAGTSSTGIVWAQVISGNTVYAGGSFTGARPAGAAQGVNVSPRGNIMAYDINTGVMTGFAPMINGSVKALEVSADGKTLYVGGSFTKVGDVTRFNFAAFDTATGALLNTVKPAIGGSYVNSIVVGDGVIYVGGLLGAAGGQTRKNLAAVSATNGAVLGWAPTTDLQVDTMVMDPTGSKLIVGGRFGTVNGSAQRGLAALDPTTGATVPWAAPATIRNGVGSGTGAGKAGISTLTTDGTAVYGTGWVFAAVTVGNLEGIFSAEAGTGNIRWIADCHGDHYGVYSDGTNVYSTSHEHDCSTVGGFPQAPGNPGNMRHATIYTAAAKGTLTRSPSAGGTYADWNGYPAPAAVNWYPDWTSGTASGSGQAGWTVTGNDKFVVFGGEFPFVNAQRSQGIARFAVNPEGGAKNGPRVTGTAWVPTAKSSTTGTVRVTIPANFDRDDLTLTYELWEDGAASPAATRKGNATFWNRPNQSLTVRGLVPGSTHTYRVVAKDGDGNSATSAPVTATVGSAPASAYADAVLNDGAFLYWRLGGSNAAGGTDWAGTDNAAWASNVSTTTDSAIVNESNGAGTFSGTSNSYGRTSASMPGSSSFSMETWFKTGTNSGGKLMGFGNQPTSLSGSYDRHVYMTNAGKIAFGVYYYQAHVLTSSASYNDNAWHHVVAQMSNSGMQLFIDGVLIGTDPATVSSDPYTGYWRLGGDQLSGWPNAPWSNFFSGRLDEFAVYPAPLTPQQVATHHAIGAGQGTPTAAFTANGTELAWSFDGSASTAPSGRTITGYAWNFGDGATGTGAQATHTYTSGGTKSVTLTVTDSLGITSSKTSTITVAEPHVAPVSSFTTTVAGQVASVDASASTASDGATLEYAWNWGDGTSGAGATATHAYAAEGTYDITLTLTDSMGATSTLTKQVTLTAESVVASDNFERTVGSGWGTAPVGGTWSGTTGLAVSGGVGTMTLGKSNTRRTTLAGSTGRDVDARISVQADKVADGGGLHMNLAVQKSSAGEYHLKVRTQASGAVLASLTKVVGTTETQLAVKTLAGVTYTGGMKLNLRLQTGTDAARTTLAAKVWLDGTAEPTAWTVTTSDGEPGLQTAGEVGFVGYLAGTVTNGPVTVSVDDLRVAAEPVHVAPVAAFTNTVAGLDAAFDSSGSTVAAGSSITGYAWDFGDGATSTEANPSHTYAADGTYTVTLRVTDDTGATSEVASHSVSVAGVVIPFVARDDFERTQANGWGTADAGGAWTGGAGFSVANGVGVVTLSKGQTRTAALADVSAADTDSRLRIGTDKVADGGGIHLSYFTHKSAAGDYRVKLRIAASGSTVIHLTKTVGATETVISSRTLTGYTHTAGSVLNVHLKTTTAGGATTLAASVWPDGATEPASWTITGTDSQAELQGAGQVGVLTYLSASTTNGPIAVTVDGLEVR